MVGPKKSRAGSPAWACDERMSSGFTFLDRHIVLCCEGMVFGEFASLVGLAWPEVFVRDVAPEACVASAVGTLRSLAVVGRGLWHAAVVDVG